MSLRTPAFLLLAVSLAGCDRPTGPASPPGQSSQGGTPKKEVLRPGVVRLSPLGSVPPEVTREPAYRPGLPTLSLNVEYSGPKPGLRVDAQGFEHGKSAAEAEDVRALELPLSGEVAFGFGESKNSQGMLLAAVIERFSDGPSPSTGLISKRSGSVGQMGISPIGSRKWKVYQPAWPLEIPDGTEEIIWGVFVGEPPESKEDTPLQERVKRAEAAWIFKVSTTELPKK